MVSDFLPTATKYLQRCKNVENFNRTLKKKKKSVLLVQSKWYASVRKNKVATAVFY